MKEVKLKKGDWVVMHTCIEATNPENYGKLWQCKTDQFTRGKGVYAQDSVFLEGYSGSFAPEFLQKVNLPTIKPGDKVRHDDWGDGVVYALDQDDSAIAIVDFDDEGLMSIHCDDLEVVE